MNARTDSDSGEGRGALMTEADWQALHADRPSSDMDDALREQGPGAVIHSIATARKVEPGGSAELERLPIKATPYVCRDPSAIAQRPWVYGRQFLRGSLSVIVAPGAIGKTSLMVGTALALVTARPLLDKTVWDGPLRVWLWNLEDSGDELARLIEAARLHWRIDVDDIGDRLFVDSGLDGAGLCMAVEDHAGFRILEPVVAELVAELIARQIDVLIVDPFVSCHSVSENNNGAIDAVAKKWARVGVQANCAIGLVHHTKKLNGQDATADGARGASALPNAARSVIALNRMAPDEAAQWGIEGDDRRRYFRAYDDKNNRSPPASKSDWYQLASVDLGNGPEPGQGDNMQVVLPWTPPDAFSGLSWEHLRDVQAKLGTEEAPGDAPARLSPQSDEWAGETVAAVLGLDVAERKGTDAARVKALLRGWLGTGALVQTKEKDPKKRDERPFIRAGIPAEPESAPL